MTRHMLSKLWLCFVFILLLTLPILKVDSQDGQTDPDVVLHALAEAIDRADTARSNGDVSLAVADYEVIIDEIRHVQQTLPFHTKRYADKLASLHFRALSNLSTAQLQIILKDPDPMSRFLQHDWQRSPSDIRIILPKLDEIAGDLEESLKIAISLQLPSSDIVIANSMLGITRTYSGYLSNVIGEENPSRGYFNQAAVVFEDARKAIGSSTDIHVKRTILFGIIVNERNKCAFVDKSYQQSAGCTSDENMWKVMPHLEELLQLIDSEAERYYPLGVSLELSIMAANAEELSEPKYGDTLKSRPKLGIYSDLSLRLSDMVLPKWETSILGVYAGIAKARVAWVRQDKLLATQATSLLERGIGNLQNSPINQWDCVAAYHYYGAVLMLNGEKADVAFQSLRTVEQELLSPKTCPKLDFDSSIGRSILFSKSRNSLLIGENLQKLGRYDEAIDVLTRELNVINVNVRNFSPSPSPEYYMLIDWSEYTNLVYSLSNAFQSAKRFSSAIELLEDCIQVHKAMLELAKEQKFVEGITEQSHIIAETLRRKSIPLSILGQLEDAQIALQDAEVIVHDTNDAALKAEIAVSKGDIYLQLQDLDAAIRAFEEVTSITEIGNLSVARAKSFLGLATIDAQRNRFEPATTKLNSAIDLAEQNGLADVWVHGLILRGDLQLHQSADFLNATKSYKEAFEVATNAGDQSLQILSLEALGRLQIKYEPQLADLTLYRALVLAVEIEDNESIAQIYGMIATLERSRQQYDLAERSYKNALDVIELAQKGFVSERLSALFASLFSDTYADYIEFLVSQGRFEEAFQISERSRAQAFVTQLSRGPVNILVSASPQVKEREQALRDTIQTIRLKLLEAKNADDRDQIENFNRELQRAEREYSEFFDQLQATNPKFAELTAETRVSVEDVQSFLDENTTLVSYFVTSQMTYVFIVANESFDCINLPVSRDFLSDQIKTFLSAKEDQSRSILSELSKELLRPIEDKLKTKHIIVAPHNVMNYLPYAALLMRGGQSLIYYHDVTTLPSASTLKFLPKKPTKTGGFFGLANPTSDLASLGSAESEVDAIKKLIGGSTFKTKQATEEIFVKRAQSSGIILIAAHGTTDSDNPLFSALHLAPSKTYDGRLEVHEIYQLDLSSSTEIVVLSACSTAIGKTSKGDEVLSIGRAFLYAGVPSVLMTLWNVDDKSTAIFMESFFKAKVKGMSYAEALQTAQLELQAYTEDGIHPYQNPYYWAGFILVGRS